MSRLAACQSFASERLRQTIRSRRAPTTPPTCRAWRWGRRRGKATPQLATIVVTPVNTPTPASPPTKARRLSVISAPTPSLAPDLESNARLVREPPHLWASSLLCPREFSPQASPEKGGSVSRERRPLSRVDST
jgi:hypothetical protein